MACFIVEKDSRNIELRKFMAHYVVTAYSHSLHSHSAATSLIGLYYDLSFAVESLCSSPKLAVRVATKTCLCGLVKESHKEIKYQEESKNVPT